MAGDACSVPPRRFDYSRRLGRRASVRRRVSCCGKLGAKGYGIVGEVFRNTRAPGLHYGGYPCEI
jgi:hypothetical protein